MLERQYGVRGMLEGHGKVAVIGVGSEANGDDRAGMLVAERLKGAKTEVFLAGQSPESFTHLSKKGYSHIIIVDAVHFGGLPGEIRYFEGGKFGGNAISAHTLPLKLFIEYMQKNCSSKIILAGIEPKNLEFGAGVSGEAEAAIERLAKEMEEALI